MTILGFKKTIIWDFQIKPVIDQVFKYEELPAAYEKVMKKKGRGKTIVDFNDMSKES